MIMKKKIFKIAISVIKYVIIIAGSYLGGSNDVLESVM